MFLSAVLDGRGQPGVGTSAEVVPWWSFTKTLIAACVLRLAEENRVKLDEPLAGRLYTPRQLLQHRAGLGDYGALPAYRYAVAQRHQPWTFEEMLARVDAGGPRYRPGAGWGYSNVGYAILRRLVEEACGSDLEAALRRLVFDPLGLAEPRLARNVNDMSRTVFSGVGDYHPDWVFHGLVIGPIVDASRALHGILESDLISPSARAAMRAAHPVGGALEGRPWRSSGYGLGLMIGAMQSGGTRKPKLAIGHSAGGPGSVGAVYHFPEGSHPVTVAVFMAGSDDGIAEYEALRLACDNVRQ